MDIPVSRLNHRMALQLPAELPLGLVFVVGQIDQFLAPGENGGGIAFYLSDAEHRIRCCLSARASDEIRLSRGDLIRAGGHLAFDTSRADYYLLARDVEILKDYQPPRSALSEIIADASRRNQATVVAPEEMPEWVKDIAPPELKKDWERQVLEEPAGQPDQVTEERELLTTARGDLSYPADEPALANLSDELIAFLSEAMDSDETVEITSELLGSLGAPEQSPQVQAAANNDSLKVRQAQVTQDGTIVQPAQEPVTAAGRVKAGKAVRRRRRAQDTVPWYLVVAVLLLFFAFMTVIVYALMLQSQ